MNFALSNLYNEKKFHNYDYFFLVTNDTLLQNKPIIKKLIRIMEKNEKVAILSPCSAKWGEKHLFRKKNIMYDYK